MSPGHAIPVLLTMRERLRKQLPACDAKVLPFVRGEIAALNRAIAALERESERRDLPTMPKGFREET